MEKRVHITEKHDIKIDRSSKWGNPYTHKELTKTKASYKVPTRKEAIERYEKYFIDNLLCDIEELRDKTLACHCKENQSCHGDVILKYLRITNRKEMF